MSAEAAIAAACPTVMKTGSIRMVPYATWLDDRQTGTSRLSHSSFFGVIAR